MNEVSADEVTGLNRLRNEEVTRRFGLREIRGGRVGRKVLKGSDMCSLSVKSG